MPCMTVSGDLPVAVTQAIRPESSKNMCTFMEFTVYEGIEYVLHPFRWSAHYSSRGLGIYEAIFHNEEQNTTLRHPPGGFGMLQ